MNESATRPVPPQFSPDYGNDDQHDQEREQDQQQQQDTQSPSSPYVSYTEKTGRTWGTRMKKQPHQNLLMNTNENNEGVSSSIPFEEKLLQSKFAEAFEVDGTALPQYQQEQEQKH